MHINTKKEDYIKRVTKALKKNLRKRKDFKKKNKKK